MKRNQSLVWTCVYTLAAMLLALFGGLAPLSAQTNNASISGTVTDATGAVMSGATVQVKNTGTGATQTFTTDAQGRYRAPDLQIGSYDVQASQQGFQNVIHSGITVTVGSQNVVDFSLPVGQAQQTVTVSGEVSQVNTESSTVGELVSEKQMRDLPLNGRNFEQLLSLAPGVQQLPNSGGELFGNGQNYSVAGSRPEGQAILLDDTDIQGFWNHGTGSGFLGTSLGVEAIQEFQTVTNTYTAQYGGNGAVVNAATKSGTNSFHGSLYEFLRNSDLDARNFFDGATIPPFRRNQFGGSLGGPIKKDKVFFFFNYEGLRQNLGETGVAYVPDAEVRAGYAPNASGTGYTYVGVSPSVAPILALYPLPNGAAAGPGVGIYNSVASQVGNENYFIGRIDYNISTNDSFFGRYVSDRAGLTSPYAGSQIPLWPESDSTRNQYFTSEERHVFSPSLINIVRGAFVRPVEAAQTTGNTPPLEFIPGVQNGNVTLGGLTYSTIGAQPLVPFVIAQNRYYGADDMFWTKGNHSITFGVTVARVQSNLNAPYTIGGDYTFNNITQLLQGTPASFFGPQPGETDAYRDFREIDVTPYIQDQWKVTKTLTLNLGFRYDFATDPVGVRHPLNTIVEPPLDVTDLADASTGFTQVPYVFAHNPNLKNFDPRFGFAWDPFKDHKTSVRGGFGIFHDPVAPRTYASDYYLAPPFAFTFLPYPSFPAPFANYTPGGPAPPTSILEGVDYQINTAPYQMQYNFNIQREVMTNTVLSVGYVGSRGVHLFIQHDQNPPIASIGPNGQPVFASLVDGEIVTNPRLDPNFSYVNNSTPSANSNYNSLQVSLNRRFTRNVQALVSYTWSKCLDDGSGTFGLENAFPWENPYNGQQDYGRCSFDIESALHLSTLVALPFHGNRLVEGWQLTGILSLTSGPPFDINDGFDQAGLQIVSSGAQERPDYISGCKVILGSPNEYFNPNCFSLQPVGTLGNLGRDVFSGPGVEDFDFAVLKNTRIRENVALQFRAEFFNIFNHPNLPLPNGAVFTQGANGTGVINPLAGVIQPLTPYETVTTSRQIQFALKLVF